MQVDGSILSCRICLEEGDRKEFIAPCSCAGTSKWVHRSCLDTWRSVREDKAFSRCTECLTPYKLVCITDDSFSNRCCRRTRFYGYIIRDFSIVLLASNAIIALLGLITYAFDKQAHNLIKLCKLQKYPTLFYYLFGLLLALSVVGMVCSCMPRSDQTPAVQCCAGCDAPYIYPFGYAHGGGDSCSCCCGNCCRAGAGAHGGGATCCECGHCATAGAVGEEAFICVLVVLVVFAVIGVFYCVGLGAYYLQLVSQRHVHVLGKRSLTREYVVADLAEDALSGEGGGAVTVLHGDLESAVRAGEPAGAAPLSTRPVGGGEVEMHIMASAPSLWSSAVRRGASSSSGYRRLDSGSDDDIAVAAPALRSEHSPPSAPRATSSTQFENQHFGSSIFHAELAVPSAPPAPAGGPYGGSYPGGLTARQREELSQMGLL